VSRVLVTGASGFIGRHVLPMLVARDHEVHAVSSRDATAAVPGVRWHRADLLEPGAPARLAASVGAERLLHLAWYAEPGKYWTSPLNYEWVARSLELVGAFRAHGGQRVVAAGTCAEYDWSSAGTCREGVTPLAPATPYGVCKRALSDMLASWGATDGFQVAWGRVFFLYGPHEHPGRAVSSVVRALLRREPARCSDGRQVRDFMHVEDVASAFARLVESDVVGAVNVASGEGVALRDVFERIATQLDARAGLQLGALAPRAGEPAVLVADATRLREELGWRPSIDLDTGLARTIAWWRTHPEHG
jgi:nucleoside-diphosphate-sugar epimerase